MNTRTFSPVSMFSATLSFILLLVLPMACASPGSGSPAATGNAPAAIPSPSTASGDTGSAGSTGTGAAEATPAPTPQPVPSDAYHAPLAAVAPVADGNPDDPAWAQASWAPIDQVWIGNPVDPGDYQGWYKAVWTPERFYVLMKFYRSQLNDKYPDEQGSIWEYDCAEIFLDENHNHGNHQRNYSAFAYHMTTTGNAYDQGNKGAGWVNMNENITVRFAPSTTEAKTYYWECELKIFDVSYKWGKPNTPLTLYPGKVMGFLAAYNTNNGGTRRKNMIGSAFIPGTDKNTAWMTADVFGHLVLDGPQAEAK